MQRDIYSAQLSVACIFRLFLFLVFYIRQMLLVFQLVSFQSLLDCTSQRSGKKKANNRNEIVKI